MVALRVSAMRSLFPKLGVIPDGETLLSRWPRDHAHQRESDCIRMCYYQAEGCQECKATTCDN